MLVPPNIHKYRDSSDCINRQTKSPTQLLTNTKRKVLVNKCVGNIYSTIYRCWYPQIFINIGIQVIA